jgi:Big-like domain-containing protein
VVKSYLQSQELVLRATTTRVDVNREVAEASTEVAFTATVAPLATGRPTPTGAVTFLADAKTATKPVPLNKRGQATVKLKFEPGVHQIMASYTPGKPRTKAPSNLPSTSPVVLHTALTLKRGNVKRAGTREAARNPSTLICPIPPARASRIPPVKSR